MGEAIERYWDHDTFGGKNKREYVRHFWRQFEIVMYGTADGKRKTSLFGTDNVRISDDGGFSKVPGLSSCPRATKGVYKFVSIVVNIGIVAAQAYLVINEVVPDVNADRFLIS